MNFFDKNIAFLPSIVLNDLQDIDNNSDYKIVEEYAENEEVNIRIILEEESFFVHDQKEPSKEANQWVQNVLPQKDMVFIVFGFGLAYHIEALLKKCQGIEGIKIIVIEPCKDLLIKALQIRDLSNVLSNPSVSLVTATKESTLFMQLQMVLPINLVTSGNVSVLLKESLTNNLPIYNEYAKRVRRYLIDAEVGRNTLLTFSTKWTKSQ